jgi:hypothetical protein
MSGRERETAREASHAPARQGRPEPQGALARLAGAVGNAAFARLARQGSGILPDGRVHRDVEEAIAASRGRGRPLDGSAREAIGPRLGDSLADVRVHDDARAAALADAVSARAFTTGADIYFGHGQYRPGTAAGDRLIAHELTHVVQQRGAPAAGPLTVSEPGDALEREADATVDELYGG